MTESATELDPERLRRRVYARLEGARSLPEQLAEPNLPGVRRSLRLLREAVEDLNRAAGLPAAATERIDRQVLQHGLPSLLALRRQDLTAASERLFGEWAGVAWQQIAGRGAVENPWLEGSALPEEDLAAEEGEAGGEWQVTFNTGLVELFQRELGTGRARLALRRLMAHLSLSQDDLGRLFGVSGETVRRWERGKNAVPPHQEAAVLAAEEGLDRLLEIFRPERLPAAIRRPAELFAGETALEWILRGRIGEVADRYETVLRYQA